MESNQQSSSQNAPGSFYSKQAIRKKQLIFKIILLGDCSVGKTSIIQNYIRKSISAQYKPTIGADFFSKKINLTNIENPGAPPVAITMQVWDTAGQERYQSLGAAFYRGAEACILVYDITSSQTFEHLGSWRQNFLEKAMPTGDPSQFPFFIFGNKKDKEIDRQVSQQSAKEWCKKNGNSPFQETSALDQQVIEQAFEQIARDLYKKSCEQGSGMKTNDNIKSGSKLDTRPPKSQIKQKSKCC